MGGRTLFRSGRSGRKVDGLNHGRACPGHTAEAPHLRPLWLRQGPALRLRLQDRLEGQNLAVREGTGGRPLSDDQALCQCAIPVCGAPQPQHLRRRHPDPAG